MSGRHGSASAPLPTQACPAQPAYCQVWTVSINHSCLNLLNFLAQSTSCTKGGSTSVQDKEVEISGLSKRVVAGPDIPHTTFTCEGRPPGYYADVETGCQVYHLCVEGGTRFSYSCPNGTLFRQRMLICAHWYQVNCSRSAGHFAANLRIGQRDKPFIEDFTDKVKFVNTLDNPDDLQTLNKAGFQPNSQQVEGLRQLPSGKYGSTHENVFRNKHLLSHNSDLQLQASNKHLNYPETTSNTQIGPSTNAFGREQPSHPTVAIFFASPTKEIPVGYSDDENESEEHALHEKHILLQDVALQLSKNVATTTEEKSPSRPAGGNANIRLSLLSGFSSGKINSKMSHLGNTSATFPRRQSDPQQNIRVSLHRGFSSSTNTARPVAVIGQTTNGPPAKTSFRQHSEGTNIRVTLKAGVFPTNHITSSESGAKSSNSPQPSILSQTSDLTTSGNVSPVRYTNIFSPTLESATEKNSTSVGLGKPSSNAEWDSGFIMQFVLDKKDQDNILNSVTTESYFQHLPHSLTQTDITAQPTAPPLSSNLLPPLDYSPMHSDPPSLHLLPPHNTEEQHNTIELRFQDPRRIFYIPESNSAAPPHLGDSLIVVSIPLKQPQRPMVFKADQPEQQCAKCHPAFLRDTDKCIPCFVIR